MATLRTDSFTEWSPKDEEGRTSFVGIGPTGIKMTPPETIFTAAIDDVFGPHVVLGDEAEEKSKK